MPERDAPTHVASQHNRPKDMKRLAKAGLNIMAFYGGDEMAILIQHQQFRERRLL